MAMAPETRRVGIVNHPHSSFDLNRSGLGRTLSSLGDRAKLLNEQRNAGLQTLSVDNLSVDYSADYSVGSLSSANGLRQRQEAAAAAQQRLDINVVEGNVHARNLDGDDTTTTGSIYPFRHQVNFDDDGSVSETLTDSIPVEEETLESRVQEWNVFSTAPWISSHEVMELCYAGSRKAFKVLTYVFFLPAILCLLVLSKGSVLIAISNIRPLVQPDVTTSDPSFVNGSALNGTSIPVMDVDCKQYSQNITIEVKMNGTGSYNYTTYHELIKCVTLPRGYDSNTAPDLWCINVDNRTGEFHQLEHFTTDQCFVSRNYWVWSVMMMICVPYLFVFLRCAWLITFKKKNTPKPLAFICAMIIETLSAAGISLLFFLVLPSLDNAITALMFMLGVATIPSLLKVTIRPAEEKGFVRHVLLDVFAITIQVSMLIIWPLKVVITSDEDNWHLLWSAPLSLLLISTRWWENYIDAYSRLGSLHEPVRKLVRAIRKGRTKTQVVASLWKVAVTIMMMMVCVGLQVEHMDPDGYWTVDRWTAVFSFDIIRCSKTTVDINGTRTIGTLAYDQLSEMKSDWVFVWLVNCLSGLGCYFFARSAAKMQIQRLSYALPLVLSTPLLLGMMIGGCEMWNHQPCSFVNSDLSGYLFYKCYETGKLGSTALLDLWYLLPLWWLSQLWITWHVWFPKSERLAKSEKYASRSYTWHAKFLP
jgi:hypothetical protein